MRFRRSTRGFTLIELLVVVAVIGILAGVAIPDYKTYMTRSRVAEAMHLLQPVRQAVTDYYAFHGRFPRDNAQAGLLEAGRIAGDYVSAVEVAGGAIHATIDLSDNGRKVLSLRPAVVNGHPTTALLGWVCGDAPAVGSMEVRGENRTTIRGALLPASCQP